MSYSALAVGLSVAIVTAFLTVTLREHIAAIFVKDVEVIAMAGTLLLIAALYQFSDTVQVIIGGVLRGYKDTKAILYITLFCYWVVGMPLGYTLARTDLIITGGIEAKGFWIAFIVSLTLAAILLIYRLRKIQHLPDEVLLARLEKLK